VEGGKGEEGGREGGRDGGRDGGREGGNRKKVGVAKLKTAGELQMLPATRLSLADLSLLPGQEGFQRYFGE